MVGEGRLAQCLCITGGAGAALPGAVVPGAARGELLLLLRPPRPEREFTAFHLNTSGLLSL